MNQSDIAFLKSILCDEPHGSRRLIDHLVGVHMLLREWKCPPSVCRAGLFHSVLGTPAYKADCIAATVRAAIRNRMDDATYDTVRRISESALFMPLAHPLERDAVTSDRDVSNVWIANFIDTVLHDADLVESHHLTEFLTRARWVASDLCPCAASAVSLLDSHIASIMKDERWPTT